MSFVVAMPEWMGPAATTLADLGSTINAANAAAQQPTTQLLTAGADKVSAAIATVFAEHGGQFHALSTRAAAFHDHFVALLRGTGGAYASADATNAAPLQAVEQGLQALGAAVPPVNLGLGNLGGLNVGNGNTGSLNFGGGNLGSLNFGSGNLGSYNLGFGNLGYTNLGLGNVGGLNLGFGNGSLEQAALENSYSTFNPGQRQPRQLQPG